LSDGQTILLTLFNEKDKKAGAQLHKIGESFALSSSRQAYPVAFSGFRKAKNADVMIAGVETPAQAADIRVVNGMGTTMVNDLMNAPSLYKPNPQQANYNWMTAELIEWKAYDGKMTQGILYKPENFDPNKKYPLISYFYETVSDGVYRYQAPAPTPSRLNIPFFVSRGYLVLAPDIHYQKGQPALDAYNYIVSGVRHVVKMGIADSTRLGIQGQSWGGIQVAQLITMTPLFKAAWAGAPVANMTSAYGGIRWESGLNRQFQYEKTQSRIGATLWERQDLYIKNSPLFALPRVTTPLVIMHNDADGAVPWYQGIELFTGLRRLQKPVWMLNYNGEAHNLVERRNRKDIQIREQQFFDWLLLDGPQAKWLKEGVPAVMKGRDWGLGE
jgi:dipeptidyl aminopeptidase/acylaminoacyl peptidase